MNDYFSGIDTGFQVFNGTGTGNTLSYYGVQYQAITIDLATDSVKKGPIPNTSPQAYYMDYFTDIQTFVGSYFGFTTFQSVGTGNYTFTAWGDYNTLDYSNDQNGVTINLKNDTVTKDPIPRPCGRI